MGPRREQLLRSELIGRLEAGAWLVLPATGLLLGGFTPLPAAPVEEVWIDSGAAPEVTRTLDAPCPDVADGEQARLDDTWERLTEAQEELSSAQAVLNAFLGEAAVFDALPDDLQPAAIDARIERLIDPDVAELQWVDCTEPPCIAVLELIGPDREVLSGMLAGAEPLQDGFGVDVGWEWAGMNDGKTYLTVPLGLPDDTPQMRHRINLREEQLLAELSPP